MQLPEHEHGLFPVGLRPPELEEFDLTSGLDGAGEYGLGDALAHFGVADGPVLNVVQALGRLLQAMLPHIDLPRALLRGRYTAAVARMEWTGVPLDVARYAQLRDGWGRLRDTLIGQVDEGYGVFVGRKFQPRLWDAWLKRRGIPWPRLDSGAPDLSLDAFRDVALAYPEVKPMKDLRASLAQLQLFCLAVGPDGRNRCPLRPFASKTGRNQPSTAEFIFGPATWLRRLIKPQEGTALAYVDYEQQEFGIAAALSGDTHMRAAYTSGDPYLTFARQAGAVPADATKQTHHEEREAFKACALGVQYGMGAESLALRLGVPVARARDLLRLHKRTYPRYWAWSKAVERQAFEQGQLQAVFGWRLHVGPGANPRSVRNFPLQGNGAEMLRLACCALTEAGVRVCAPVHDALLVEAAAADIEQVVDACQRAMEWAGRQALGDFILRTEAKVVRFPGRYMDPRGRAMWDRVSGILSE
jgi:DNA polymerase-1